MDRWTAEIDDMPPVAVAAAAAALAALFVVLGYVFRRRLFEGVALVADAVEEVADTVEDAAEDVRDFARERAEATQD